MSMPNHRATIDVRAARDVYRRGGNVIAFLKESYGDAVPLSEIIEVAYDLQAGSYVAAAEARRESVRPYWNEMAAHVREHGNAPVTVLDAGTGELTTLCGLWESLGGMRSAERVYAFGLHFLLVLLVGLAQALQLLGFARGLGLGCGVLVFTHER